VCVHIYLFVNNYMRMRVRIDEV